MTTKQDYEQGVATLAETTALPPGYSLDVRPQRRYAIRNLWTVAVLRDGAPVWRRSLYNAPLGIVMAAREAWRLAGASE